MEYTPVTIVSTTKEPTVIFKGYSQLYNTGHDTPASYTCTFGAKIILRDFDICTYMYMFLKV